MQRAVYNSGIPYNIPRSVESYTARLVRRLWLGILLSTLIRPSTAFAADWSSAEQQLARKIVAVTGPGTVALTFENRSSLGRRDSDIVQNGLRAALGAAGIHFVKPEQAAASVAISLSENSTSYVWVAEIHQGAAESAVVMVAVPRAGRIAPAHDATPLSLHKSLLWSQSERILDVAVLEENTAPTRIAVLSPDNITFYRSGAGKWQSEQVLAVAHPRPWPLDLRGRLVVNKDRLLDAYLPGVICHSASISGTLVLNCREGDDPWPMTPAAVIVNAPVFPGAGGNGASLSISPLAAFFAPTRNFFTGVLTPAVGKFANVPKFYSAAFVPRDKYTLWFFTATDGKVHIVDGMNDQASMLDWGSDIVTLRTSCGAGWQVLAAAAGEQDTDSVRAYEFPDRDPVAVSAGVEMPGKITGLWTETRGDSAVAIVSNQETGSYEAYRLALACNQ